LSWPGANIVWFWMVWSGWTSLLFCRQEIVVFNLQRGLGVELPLLAKGVCVSGVPK